jgi:hypothetical protein
LLPIFCLYFGMNLKSEILEELSIFIHQQTIVC